MFGLVVELLAGRYAAAAYNDRSQAEWPPHPARLFSALVATWAEHEPRESAGESERAALEWLEQLEAPEIWADRTDRVAVRTVMPAFVPVNDEYEVSPVDTDKLQAAEVDAASAEGPGRTKADKTVEKLRKKLLDDTAKAIAVPAKLAKEGGLRVLPEHRGKQPRTFPVVVPETPLVAFAWPNATPSADVAAALSRLLARLVRLGHSSSMVRAFMATGDVLAKHRDSRRRFRPDDEAGRHVIRWVSPGQVGRLVQAYDLHRETEPRVLPARLVRYTELGEAEAARTIASSFSDDWIVLERVDGPRLPITSGPGLARQFRRAMMACADQPVAPIISGHRGDGANDVDHAAYVPLPFIGHRHADGAILGIAIILPRSADEAAKRAIARAITSMEDRGGGEVGSPQIRLNLGERPLILRRLGWEPERATVASSRWSAPSRRWATATPIALDRNPGDLHDLDAERRAAAFANATASVHEAVARIGLPAPIEIDVVRSCVVPGNAKPHTYPRFPVEPSKLQRVLVHARLVFAEPVRGPLVLGAGRFQGLGLCLPMDRTQEVS